MSTLNTNHLIMGWPHSNQCFSPTTNFVFIAPPFVSLRSGIGLLLSILKCLRRMFILPSLLYAQAASELYLLVCTIELEWLRLSIRFSLTTVVPEVGSALSLQDSSTQFVTRDISKLVQWANERERKKLLTLYVVNDNRSMSVWMASSRASLPTCTL